MMTHTHARDEVAERRGIAQRHRRRLQRDIDPIEPGALQLRDGRRLVGEVPRIPPAAEMTTESGAGHKPVRALQQTREISAAAALRNEPAARTQRPEDAAEGSGVIGNPMKRGCAEYRIERLGEGKPFRVPANQAHTWRLADEPLACLSKHRCRLIEADDEAGAGP